MFKGRSINIKLVVVGITVAVVVVVVVLVQSINQSTLFTLEFTV